MDRSISCWRVTFADFFFFAVGSVVVVAGAAAVGAGAAVAGAAAVGGGAVVVVGAVAAGASAGAGAAGVAAGAVVVSGAVPGVFWAIKTPAGTHANTAAAATMRENFCI